MPSFEHEALVQLFRNRPALAAELWSLVTGEPEPEFDEADVSDASVGELVPMERRADLVVLFRKQGGSPLLGIVVEVQLAPDPEKRYAWPLYSAALASRERCPVALLVVCPSGPVADWARGILEEHTRRSPALVIGPGAIPRLGALPEARRTPEMAVLATKAHAFEPGGLMAALETLGMLAGLPADRAVLYFDMILSSLDAAARRALEELMLNGRYEYQSEFARKYFNQGKEEGRLEGREEGREEGRGVAQRELATRLLSRGHSVTEVAELTGLVEEEVRRLQH